MTGKEASPGSDLEELPARYAAWRGSALGRVTDALEQALILDLVGLPVGLRILDAGCGDGVLATELSARGASVTGVDASAEMIAAARRRAGRMGGDATFQLARVEVLPFDDDSFDVVVAVTMLCFVEDAERAMKEMVRVLKPGGRLILGELGRCSLWAVLRRAKGWLGSPVWRGAHFRSPSELMRLALQANLAEIAVTGAIFYPPSGIAARLLGPIDRKIGQWTKVGAAFLTLRSVKPRPSAENDGVECGSE